MALAAGSGCKTRIGSLFNATLGETILTIVKFAALQQNAFKKNGG